MFKTLEKKFVIKDNTIYTSCTFFGEMPMINHWCPVLSQHSAIH